MLKLTIFLAINKQEFALFIFQLPTKKAEKKLKSVTL